MVAIVYKKKVITFYSSGCDCESRMWEHDTVFFIYSGIYEMFFSHNICFQKNLALRFRVAACKVNFMAYLFKVFFTDFFLSNFLRVNFISNFFIQQSFRYHALCSLTNTLSQKDVVLANYTCQQRQKRSSNSYLFRFYKLYCIRFLSPFLPELGSFCKKLFWSSENHHIQHLLNLSDKKF